jgi:hypothetical protein
MNNMIIFTPNEAMEAAAQMCFVMAEKANAKGDPIFAVACTTCANKIRAMIQPEPTHTDACETCKDTGQTCVGNSGLVEDGNAPVLEPCPECAYGESAKHTKPFGWACWLDDQKPEIKTAQLCNDEPLAYPNRRPLYDHPQNLAPLHAAGFESITDLRAAYEAAKQDAARYRWLKAVTSEKREPYSNSFYWSVAREYGGKGEIFRGNRLDIVIDAAIAAAPSPEAK